MMSPRRTGRYGKSFSYHAPLPWKTNLFTRRWSPTRRVGSMDCDGILKAWMTNVVPNRTSRIVTRRDSTKSISESRRARSAACVRGSWPVEASIDCGNGESVAICCLTNLADGCEAFQRGACGGLFGFLLAATLRRGESATIMPDFNLKQFLVLGTGLTPHSILYRGQASPL